MVEYRYQLRIQYDEVVTAQLEPRPNRIFTKAKISLDSKFVIFYLTTIFLHHCLIEQMNGQKFETISIHP